LRRLLCRHLEADQAHFLHRKSTGATWVCLVPCSFEISVADHPLIDAATLRGDDRQGCDVRHGRSQQALASINAEKPRLASKKGESPAWGERGFPMKEAEGWEPRALHAGPPFPPMIALRFIIVSTAYCDKMTDK
jgi:hypothetical protein